MNCRTIESDQCVTKNRKIGLNIGLLCICYVGAGRILIFVHTLRNIQTSALGFQCGGFRIPFCTDFSTSGEDVCLYLGFSKNSSQVREKAMRKKAKLLQIIDGILETCYNKRNHF